ncbi:MAG: phage portal protein [Mycobacterium sp.]|nr:phage portal protein [Mycobacterium sp.]
MADLSPSEWFDKLNSRFTKATRPEWQDRLCRPVAIRPRNEVLDTLWSYNVGDAPLPQVAEGYEDVFRDVMRTARCNYAPMCVSAMLDRMELQAVSTLVDSDANADDIAAEIIDESGFAAMTKELFGFMFSMGEAFAMAVDNPGGLPTAYAIDPRRCVGIPDRTNPIRLRAALVKDWDPVDDAQQGHLFLPGRRYDALLKDGKWTVDDSKFEEIKGIDAFGGIPIVRFENAHGLGEYERHLDLLDRINDMTLKRLIIVAYQAFRQRAIIGDENDDDADDDTAEAPNWGDGVDGGSLDAQKWEDLASTIFRADPGALWKVPDGFKFWESQALDLGSILNAKRDDVKEFAAVTSTPLHLITPDAANGSAEGAGLMRESSTSKVRDRRTRVTPQMKLLWRILFGFAGQPDRGKQMKLHWGPIEFRTLAEKASASAQAADTLSLEQRCERIWEMSPAETQENIDQRAAEAILIPAAPAAPSSASTGQQQPPSAPPDAGPTGVSAA